MYNSIVRANLFKNQADLYEDDIVDPSDLPDNFLSTTYSIHLRNTTKKTLLVFFEVLRQFYFIACMEK